jgi:deoxycytidylate deaminase
MTSKRFEELLLEMFLEDPRTTNLYLYDKQRYSVHMAVLVKRGKVIASAYNRNGSRSSGSGYTDRSIHAERNVVKELGDISKIRGATMYVMRVSKHTMNTFGYSKPCEECQLFLRKCMREYGLKAVYYTDRD